MGHVTRALVERASRVHGLDPSAGGDSTPSLFDDVGEAKMVPFSVPLLPDFERVIQRQLEDPSQAVCLSRDCRLLAVTRYRENIGCGQLPPVDQAITTLISPPKFILGIAGTPSRNCKMMEAFLAKMHRAIAVQLQLANTGAILSLYQRQITQNLGEDYNPQLMEKLRQIAQVLSRLIKVQAEVAGRAMATLWLVRRHLWLSQSRLQQEDRACRMKLPVEPSVMFGQRASALLMSSGSSPLCSGGVWHLGLPPGWA